MSFFFKKSVVFTEDDAKRVIIRSLDQIKERLASYDTDLILCSSGKGVITLQAINARINGILNGQGRTSVASIATDLDIDHSTALKQVSNAASLIPNDIYMQEENVFTKGELESISNELRSLIERDKLQDADNFRSEKDIDAILLDKIINRLNVLTNSNPKIITLEGLIISEPELVSLRSKIYQLLNTAESPITLSTINLEDALFNNPKINAVILQSVPKAIEERLVSGVLENDDTFIPDAYSLLLQEKQVDILEKTGIIQLSELTQVGVKNIELFLADRIDKSNPYTILAEWVVLKSYANDVATKLADTIRSKRMVNVREVELPGVPSTSQDYVAVMNLCLHLLTEMLPDISTESVFLSDPIADKSKITIPNYILTEGVELDIKYALEEMLVAPTAHEEASKFLATNKDISQYVDREDLLTDFLSKKAPSLDENKITSFLLKEFSRDENTAKVIPTPLLVHFGGKHAPHLKALYTKTLASEVRTLYNAEKMDSLISLLVHLKGIMDISHQDKKLASKIYSGLQESLVKQSAKQPRYIAPGTAKMNMSALEKYLNTEISKTSDPMFKLESAMATQQEATVEHLGQKLKQATDPSSVLQLSTIIIHSKMLRYEKQYGVLSITEKYAPKVLKILEKRVDVKELHSLKDALKKNHVSTDLMNQVKDVALGGFH